MARRFTSTFLAVLLTACKGPALETRTFDLRYMDEGSAQDLIRPYVYTDRSGAPGKLSTTRQTLTVRETRDNLEHIARVLAEHDKPSANVRLVFQIIRADGAGPVDPEIAPIEAQLRRLFRFGGYRLLAQSTTAGSSGSPIRLRMDSPDGAFDINGGLDLGISGDSGAVRLALELSGQRFGSIVTTRLTIRLGHTAVIGGQAVGKSGALILAVRADVAEP